MQVCVHPLVPDMQRSPWWSRPDWRLHGLWRCLHHHNGTIQVNIIKAFCMEFNVVLQYLKRLCWVHLYDVGAPGKTDISSVQHFNICIFSDCSIWRRSDCRFSDGGSAWPWPWQRGLPLQLLRHAHLVLQCQALQHLLELWNRLPFFGSLSPSGGLAELLTSLDRFLEIWNELLPWKWSIKVE